MTDEHIADIVKLVQKSKENPLGIDSAWRASYHRDVKFLLDKIGVKA